MTTDDLEAFGRVMALINETYGDPNREVSDMKMRFYFHVLGDLSIEEIEAAVVRMSRTKTARAFPTPGEIREALAGTVEECAEIAFGNLIDTIHRVGRYRTPRFDDDALGAVVETLGGWQTVCNWHVEDRRWKRREFLKAYRACREGSTKVSRLCAGEAGQRDRRGGLGEAIPGRLSAVF